ncbi:hypothetical protein [[Enterobacter] lignolyticus]|uniref:Electron transfer flavoprotein alpha/beta-subunit N-terminal domain-containing protein n=1 Tax=[Enterobacter] lignolyticus TaxID=1334193 RepID=A0A806X8H9_9ENTR|nr:hypothetical protein [[Enterobacter] lignolyticus]ALR77885.1 hypothetical protein AO703_16850 [[Enterobacter] lignolyticus]
MNILLAFKAEPDLSMLSGSDWQLAARTNLAPDPTLMRAIMGNDEQGAAELVLQARDIDPALTLAAVTLGDDRAAGPLRHLAALGFGQRTLLRSEADNRFSPVWVAEQLARQVQRSGSDIVLIGTRSSEGQNGQTGWLLAEMLGWPCLTQVSGLLPVSGGVQVECRSVTGISHWQLHQPAVLMVQNRGQMALRVPGMRARLAAAHAEIEVVEAMLPGDPWLQCQTLTQNEHVRAGRVIAGGSAQESAQQLWRVALAERMMR